MILITIMQMCASMLFVNKLNAMDEPFIVLAVTRCNDYSLGPLNTRCLNQNFLGAWLHNTAGLYSEFVTERGHPAHDLCSQNTQESLDFSESDVRVRSMSLQDWHRFEDALHSSSSSMLQTIPLFLQVKRLVKSVRPRMIHPTRIQSVLGLGNDILCRHNVDEFIDVDYTIRLCDATRMTPRRFERMNDKAYNLSSKNRTDRNRKCIRCLPFNKDFENMNIQTWLSYWLCGCTPFIAANRWCRDWNTACVYVERGHR